MGAKWVQIGRLLPRVCLKRTLRHGPADEDRLGCQSPVQIVLVLEYPIKQYIIVFRRMLKAIQALC